jgi:phenylacetate-CoA ligase
MVKATFGGRTVVPSSQKKAPFWRHNWVDSQIIFSAYHASPDNLPSYVSKLCCLSNWFIQGYASQIHLVARHFLNDKNSMEELPRAIFTSSESLLPHQRHDIEAAFGARAWNRYGVGEICASMIECKCGNLHVDSEMCVMEIDPVYEETNQYIRGELVCTSWANPAMPFVRYRVNDTATMLRKPCGCGRKTPVFSQIEGRIEDYLVTPSYRFVGSPGLSLVFKGLPSIAEAQFVQMERDAVSVLVVPRKGYSRNIEEIILKRLRERVGVTMQIQIEYKKIIPRLPNGKFRFVVSKVGRIAENDQRAR